jgi:hypothetical protein
MFLFYSHHQGLAVPLLWQTLAWCSRGYPWLTPLLSILERIQRYQLHEVSYLHNIPYLILLPTLSTITMQHKIMKSFNNLPLKLHTTHIHISLFLTSLFKESSPYPTQISNEFLHPLRLPLSPFSTYPTLTLRK